MPARSIDTARISFGLVTIPVKVYSTSQPSEELHFHLVHEGCGERLKQHYVCPVHGEVDREHMAKGFQLTKTKIIELSKEELKALEAVASDAIALDEFVPSAAVDPLYVEHSYYLAPDKGGERAYRLFRDALEEAGLVGIASYSARGKQHVVMLRPFEDGLVMHQLRYPDEVKPWSEVPAGKLPKATGPELTLAGQIIESLRHDTFDPGHHTDEVKERVRELIAAKAKSGEEIEVPEAEKKRKEEKRRAAPDLMAALQASLARETRAGAGAATQNGHRAARAARTAAKSARTAARRSRAHR